MKIKLDTILARIAKADRGRLTLNALITICAAVICYGMFSGFLMLGGTISAGNVIAALVYTILIASSLTYAMHNVFRAESGMARAGWSAIVAAVMVISVTLSFGMFSGLVTSESQSQAEIVRVSEPLIDTLTDYQSAYSAFSKSASAVSEYSVPAEERERTEGGTCPGSNVPEVGPRSRLRASDAAFTSEFSRHFKEQGTAIETALKNARNARDSYSKGRHQQTMAQLQESYAVVRAAAQDQRIQDWRSKANARIEAGRGTMTDPLTGTQFSCIDPALEAKLLSAVNVKLPPLPERIEALDAPGQAKGVKRGIAIMTGKASFDARYDLLPLIMGLVIESLMAVFIRAKMGLDPPNGGNGRNGGGPGRPNQLGPRPMLALQRNLNQTPILERLGGRFDEALAAEPWQWQAVVERWSMLKSRFLFGKELVLLAPSYGATSADARVLRGIVGMLGHELRFRYEAPVKALPARFQSRLKSLGVTDKEQLIQIYTAKDLRLLDQIYRERILAYMANGNAPAPLFPSDRYEKAA